MLSLLVDISKHNEWPSVGIVRYVKVEIMTYFHTAQWAISFSKSGFLKCEAPRCQHLPLVELSHVSASVKPKSRTANTVNSHSKSHH